MTAKEKQRIRVAKWRAANPQKTAELAKRHSQEFRERNPERARELDRQRYQRDKEKRREANRDYLKRTGYESLRRKNNPQFRFKSNLSRYVRHKLNGTPKCENFISLLGCSILELRRHLESNFAPGMSWKNYGRFGWHIDHKKPCASFDLTDEQQQKVCFHYTNLQPLWAIDNLVKRDKDLVT